MISARHNHPFQGMLYSSSAAVVCSCLISLFKDPWSGTFDPLLLSALNRINTYLKTLVKCDLIWGYTVYTNNYTTAQLRSVGTW